MPGKYSVLSVGPWDCSVFWVLFPECVVTSIVIDFVGSGI